MDAKINVGDTVLYTPKFGPKVTLEVEYRGKSYGMDGYEACIIIRGDTSAPYQMMVPMSTIQVKPND